MTYEEMSNFTNEELSNFSHLQLSLDKSKILQNLINDFRDDIPSSVILKLENMCKNFITSCENNDIEIPSEITYIKSKKHFTIAEIATIIQAIIALISFAMSFFSKDEMVVNNTYITQITNCVFTNEYITYIEEVINEIIVN